MERKTFDAILTSVGAVLTLFLLVAGVLGLWAYSFTNTNVHNQLAEQQIVFPSQAAFAAAKPGTEITPGCFPISRSTRPAPHDGAQAEAYADHFIAVHLQEIGGASPTHSSRPRQCTAQGSAAYTADEAVVQTVFQGTTLRGLLLEAYASGRWGRSPCGPPLPASLQPQ